MDRDPLRDGTTVESLVRYDELPPADRERLAASSPRVRAALAHLEAADAWLAGGAGAVALAEPPRPAAEELYDAAGGPGAAFADDAARARLADHLERNPEERPWVEGLRRTPPPPLLLDPLPEDEAAAHSPLRAVPRPVAPAPRRSPGWVAWTPLATAALLGAMILGGGMPSTVLDGGLPLSPIVRGDGQSGPLFPRGRVLHAGQRPGSFAAAPRFEIAPLAGASAYRAELVLLPAESRTLFDEGESLWTQGSAAPVLDGPPLAPGRYEWRAFATVNGIEEELGARTFRVVESAPLAPRAAGTDDAARDDVVALHAAGFLTDARHRARSLPPGAERERYLSGR